MLSRALTQPDTDIYSSHQRFTTFVEQYTFVTAFFLLWSLAVEADLNWLVASKFFHCVVPIVVTKWWDLSHLPMFHYKMLQEYDDNHPEEGKKSLWSLHHGNDSKWDKVVRKYNKILRYNIIKIWVTFFILAFADLLFLTIKLLPEAIEATTSKQTTSNSFAPHNNHNETNQVFVHWFTVGMEILHIIAGVCILFEVRRSSKIAPKYFETMIISPKQQQQQQQEEGDFYLTGH